MLGNDVVDLAREAQDASASRDRFDRRVFSDGERRAIERGPDPHRVRWSLWAAKEAAYKAARRRDPSVVWSPVRFAVRPGPDPDTACVHHDSGRYAVRYLPVASGVHALAVAEPFSRLLEPAAPGGPGLLFGCRRGPVDDASAEVRRLARQGLARALGAPVDAIEVRRRERIPQLWCRGAAAEAPLSLSHHGDLLAWACCLAPGEGWA